MTQVNHLSLQADETGTLELVCERSVSDEREPAVRSFSSQGQFGILVDNLSPDERVTLFFDAGPEDESEDAFEDEPEGAFEGDGPPE